MKKIIVFILISCLALAITGCGKNDIHTISIVVPAGSTGTFIYSDEEISPTGRKITISTDDDLPETEVILKTIEVQEETAYLPETLLPGTPITMDVEKGAWFKVGVSLQNDTNTDKTVTLEIKGVETRIE